MTTSLSWGDIGLRLALAFAAGTLVGVNRGEHARPAGLRTTLLVCLAAAVAMIQVNLLLDMNGRHPDSFVMLDLMRLPLGILSGMGFIGAGAILRKGEMVVGVTTAATLWFVTVMGLCFGGGQIGLGLAALGLGLVVLWGLKWVEQQCMHDRHGTLTLAVGANGPGEEEISQHLLADDFKIHSWSVSYTNDRSEREYNCEIWWRERYSETRPPSFVKSLAQVGGVIRLGWKAN